MATELNNRMVMADKAPLSRSGQLLEVSVFLFLIVPTMVLSFFVVKQGNLSFLLVAFTTIIRNLALVSLILFFVWRNGEPVNLIGWTFKNVWKEALLGIGLYIPFFFAIGYFENLLRLAGLSVPATPLPSFMVARGMAEIVLAVVLVVVVALAEETIFRGYLILRLKAITPSPYATALLSAVIFSLGHGYEGSAGIVTVGFMGLIFALIYKWRHSLVAPIVMHFLQDFIGIVLLPLFGKG